MRLTNKWSALSLAILRFALPAQVVKLVDTLASGASARKGVEVQVLSWAPFLIPHSHWHCNATDVAGPATPQFVMGPYRKRIERALRE